MKKKLIYTIVISLMAFFALYAMGVESQPTEQEIRRGSRGRRGPMQVDPVAEARIEQLGSRGIGIHDPSTIIKCKDEYWIFYTGRGTPSYHSSDLVNWQRGPVTFTQPPSWSAEAVPDNRRLDYWAPDVINFHGKYLLFFSISTFGRNTSAIAVSTSVTLDPSDPNYKWTEPALVIKSTSRDDYNTIDPAVIADQEGNLWMSFGSFWSGIKLIQLDPETGKRISPDSPMYSLASYESIEASFIYFHDGYYYLFLDWGMCCRGVNSTYNMRVGRSKKITGPYLDKEGKDMLDKGGSLLLDTEGAFIGPGHPGIIKVDDNYLLGMHFYNGARNGASQYAIRPLEWDKEGWPYVVTPPMELEAAETQAQ